MNTLDPTQYVLNIGGHIVSGFAPSTMINVSRANDTWKKTVGATGEVVRSRNRDRTGTITVTLLQTSPSNLYLSGLNRQDEALGTGIVPVQVKDNLGTTVISAPQAWVLKPADVTYGDEVESREWTLDCADLDMLVGGNP